MSFIRLDLLPRRQRDVVGVKTRWDSDVGAELRQHITQLIRDGAGEDFLQSDFEHGRLGFLEDYWDLAGFSLSNEDITFPDGDSFENIDFSQAEFWHVSLTNACFPQTHFYFARFYNVRFERCIFALAYFYGCRFEKCTFINCDFIDGNGFANCEISEVEFRDCFFSEDIFKSCKFDENVTFVNVGSATIHGLIAKANRMKEKLETNRVSGIYRGIKNGFRSGEIFGKARAYLFLQRKAYTRFNDVRKLQPLIWELAAGYGVRPLRIVFLFMTLFGLCWLWFYVRTGLWNDSLILSAGAFLTFGAKTDLLASLRWYDETIYIISAFAGVSLIALFVTVLASVLLKDN